MIENIVIVYDYAYVNGGAADVAIQSAIGLAEKYKVHFFSAVGPVCEELKQSKVRVECLGMDDINTGSRIKAIVNGVWNRYAKKRFAMFLSDFDPNTTIVHFHGWGKALSCSVVAVARKMGFKPIITLHDYFTLCPNGGFYNYQKNHICGFKSMCWRCVLTNCDKRSYGQKLWRCVRQIVQDGVVRDKADITYLSISSQNEALIRGAVKSKHIVRVDNPVRLAQKKNLSITASRRFLYVGRLSEEKGVELFCQAIEQLKQKYPDVEGMVVGAGEMETYLKERYTSVDFVGWKSQEEVNGYMTTARALVFPSKWYEGAPLTTTEAMSAGLPCIVSLCTSATEYIRHNINGLIFTSCNVEELIECMTQLLDNNVAMHMQEHILREFDAQHYSLQSHIERLMAVYEEINKI